MTKNALLSEILFNLSDEHRSEDIWIRGNPKSYIWVQYDMG